MALANELTRAAPERAALIVEAMADRKQTVVLPAVLKAAGNGPKQVRLAAIGALGRVGDATCLSPLLDIALESDADLSQSARAALGDLPGDSVNKEIVARLSKAEGKTLPLLLDVVGQRRIDAIDAILKAVDHSDKEVRSAALTALGATVDLKRLPVLIAQVVKPKNADDAKVAEAALKTACVRMPDREACAAELAAAIDRASVRPHEKRSPGGHRHRRRDQGPRDDGRRGEKPRSEAPGRQHQIARRMGQRDAAPALLELSKSAAGEKFQVRALNGYIRIANKFIMPEPDRTQMCKIALEAAKQPAEQKKVLDVLRKYPSLENLKLAVQATAVAGLKEDATQAAMAIAQKVGTKSPEAREILAKLGLDKVKLEIIKAEYGAGASQKDVTELLQKQAADLPLINLPNASYNASFGGDPAPNTPKQLKIKYKLNDKTGEVTLAEDALILLPTPK